MRASAALLVALLAGCSSGGGPAPTAAPSQPSASATTAVASPTPSPTPATASASPSATPAGVTVVSVPRGFAGGFATPSGNVRCDVDVDFVRCEARERPWAEQPREPDCGGTARWTTRLVLHAERGAALRGECGYDPPTGGPPLAYGTRLDLGRTRCFSERTGLTCWVAGTRRGFFVSRAAYRLTASPPRAAAAARPSPAPAGPVLVVPRGFRGGFRAHDIVCDISDAQVHCLPHFTRWSPPPATEPCVDGDESTEVILRTGRGRAFTGCRSDSLAGGDALRPGRGVRVGDMRCDATASAIECRNLATGHGFVVSAREFRGY